MKEADKCCCNCEHCKRVEIKGQIECICEYDTEGMMLSYVGVFTHKCERWEKETKWEVNG